MWTLPNVLTLARIGLTPVVALLPFIRGFWPKVAAFAVFLIAAVSDAVDGRMARSRGQVSDLGKLLDPLADKLLLLATLVPIFALSRRAAAGYGLPLWGGLPLWVVAVLLGRELCMTIFRDVARRRGVVIAAAGPGKAKTIMQDIFIGATILWFALYDGARDFRWRGWLLDSWRAFHGSVVAMSLALAIVLTCYSLGVYLYRYRALLRGAAGR